MKKFLRFICSIIFAFSLIFINLDSVFALDNISVSNITEADKSNDSTIKINKFDNNTINLNYEIHNIGDFVSYNLILDNNSGKDITILSVTDNNEIDNILNTYSFSNENVVTGSKTNILATAKYVKKIDSLKQVFNQKLNIFITYSYDEEVITKTIDVKHYNSPGSRQLIRSSNNVKNINNSNNNSIPNTHDNIFKYLIIFITGSLLLLIILVNKKYNKKVNMMIILIGILVICPSVYATSEFITLQDSLTLEENVQFTLYNSFNCSNYLISKANGSSTLYEDGNKSEVYTFDHEETNQLKSASDYRFMGMTPNNYVYFNCKDSSDTLTCETWRIVGVFDTEDDKGNIQKRVKIIPSTPIKNKAWSSSNLNVWSESDLMSYINEGDYWKSISDYSKNLIGPVKYYLGEYKYGTNTYDFNKITPEKMYTFERSKLSYNIDTSWIGYTGILYPSDYSYLFDKGFSDTCKIKPFDKCNDKTWFNDINGTDDTWSISPLYSSYNPLKSVSVINGEFYYFGSAQAFCEFDANPTFYLNANVLVISGDGSADNPYIIK